MNFKRNRNTFLYKSRKTATVNAPILLCEHPPFIHHTEGRIYASSTRENNLLHMIATKAIRHVITRLCRSNTAFKKYLLVHVCALFLQNAYHWPYKNNLRTGWKKQLSPFKVLLPMFSGWQNCSFKEWQAFQWLQCTALVVPTASFPSSGDGHILKGKVLGFSNFNGLTVNVVNGPKGFLIRKKGSAMVYPFVRFEKRHIENKIKKDECHSSSIGFSDQWRMDCLTKQTSMVQVIGETLDACALGKCWELNWFLFYILINMDSNFYWFIQYMMLMMQAKALWNNPQLYFQICCSFSSIERVFLHHKGCS